MNISDRKLLIVDDDISVRKMLYLLLSKEGFKNIALAESGETALQLAASENPDLIVLDIVLPDMDGYETCEKLRRFSNAPILFLSSMDEENSRLVSFAVGGDDFISKPFSSAELIARIKACLNRIALYESYSVQQHSIHFGSCYLDLDRKEVYKEGHPVTLTPKEYLLLEYLILNRGITLGVAQIVSQVWNSDFDGYENTVAVHIRHLREKLEENPSSPQFILTSKGRGYRFDIPHTNEE